MSESTLLLAIIIFLIFKKEINYIGHVHVGSVKFYEHHNLITMDVNC